MENSETIIVEKTWQYNYNCNVVAHLRYTITRLSNIFGRKLCNHCVGTSGLSTKLHTCYIMPELRTNPILPLKKKTILTFESQCKCSTPTKAGGGPARPKYESLNHS